jgi:anaerobic selenocysteine-containing dehydrogenase
LFSRVPVDAWIAHVGLDRADVERAVDVVLAARAMSVRVELGVQQGRRSTLDSYLEISLFLLTGHFGRRGRACWPGSATRTSSTGMRPGCGTPSRAGG